jgi:hypothetical protein
MIPRRIHLSSSSCCQGFRYALGVAVAYLVMALSTFSISHASNFNFRIQDYKPDRFRDMQWTLEWNLAGREYQDANVTTHDSGWLQDSRYRQYDNDGRQNSIALRSGLTCRKFSLLSMYDMASQIQLRYDRSNRNASDSCATCRDYYYSQNPLSYAFTDYENNSIEMDLRHVSDYRQYLHPYFSIGLSVSIQANFWSRRGENNVQGYREISDTGGYTNHDSWTNGERSHYRNRRVSESYKFGPAFGRQYEGKYAAAAMFALGELKKRGLLDSVPSRHAIVALADTMYFYQNEMDWNERDLRIRTSIAIANTLQSFGVWKEPSPYAVLVLDDIWQYYSRSHRLFGTLAQIRVIANKQHTHSKSQSNSQETLYRETFHADTTDPVSSQTFSNSFDRLNKYDQSSNDYRLAISISHCVPMSLRWQWNTDADFNTPLSASISNSYESNYTDSSIAKTFRLIDNYLATLSSSLEFVADRKTSILLIGVGSVERRMTNNLSIANNPHSIQNSKRRSINGNLSLLYYLSNRSIFILNITGGYIHSWNRTKVSETRSSESILGFNISMTHYIK